jgi:hypothetical protein
MSLSKIQQYTDDASPDNWMKYAQELRDAAVSMWKDQGKIIDLNVGTGEKIERPAISRVFLLNSGLSIENLLKAYMIAVEPGLINTGQLDKRLAVHDLQKLALETDLVFSASEMELLRILSEAIPYWGRYPVPRNFNQLKTAYIADAQVFELFKLLFKKIFEATFKKIENGWDAGNGVSFPNIGFHNLRDDGWEMGTASD